MNHDITLVLVCEDELPYLKEKVQSSFSVAVREHFSEEEPAEDGGRLQGEQRV